MKFWGKKTEMEELKIPIVNDGLPENRNRYTWGGIAALVAVVFGLWILLIYLVVADDVVEMKLHKPPVIHLNSLLACQTTRDSVMWDFKFEVVNPYNDSHLCIFGGFEVSVFPYNQSSALLTKVVVEQTTCVKPRNQTEVIVFGEEASSSIQNLNDYLDPISATVGLDLKIHNDASYYQYDDVGYDLVCGDVKVAISLANSSSSSGGLASTCGAMVGEPLTCSYTRTTTWNHFRGLVVTYGILYLFCCPIIVSIVSSILIHICDVHPYSH